MKIQKGFGLNITWLSPKEYRELNPGIAMKGLRGSTYSPEDGSASPLLFTQSCYLKAVEHGATFRFNETVTGFHIAHSKISAVKTNKGVYQGACVLNAAGANARGVSQLAGIDTPVNPDSHEAGITEPVKPFMGPMVVDMRAEPGSVTFYFYQNSEGQVVFCLTPDPPVWGIDSRSTSAFLPMVAQRMIKVMPLLVNLKVRRTWRGQFPRTPDDCPVVGRTKEITNFYQAVGMGGRGFMLGPGMAELLFRTIHGDQRQSDTELLNAFSPYRDSFWRETER
jgi:sarcosine oxidase subunit beta